MLLYAVTIIVILVVKVLSIFPVSCRNWHVSEQ